MNNEAFNRLISTGACKGAFKLVDTGLEPLSGSARSAKDGALRTRDVWARLGTRVSDAGLMIAKRGAAMSVASRRGGVILESDGAMNVGLLRSILQHETPVTPTVADDAVSPSDVATWSLMEWIERIEAPRQFRVDIGNTKVGLIVREGRFSVSSKKWSEAQVGELLLAAAADGTEVHLGYAPLPKRIPACPHHPLALVGAKGTPDKQWQLSPEGVITSHPETATVAQAHLAQDIGKAILAWNDGDPSEITVLKDNLEKKVIAQSDGDGALTLTLS